MAMHVRKEVTGTPFYMADFAVRDMDYFAKRVTDKNRKRDAVVIYSGEEGSGKTTLASQHAFYLAKKLGLPFGIENYYFTPDEIVEEVQKARLPAGTPFIYDEGVTGLLAKTAMSKLHIKLQIMFSTCRSKQYPIFVCIPRFYELPDWLAIDRSMVLYETYNKRVGDDPDKPGFYRGYDRWGKRQAWLYRKMRKYDLLKEIKRTEDGEFPQWPFGLQSKECPFNYEEYEERKRKSLRDAEAPKVNELDRNRMLIRDRAILLLTKETAFTQTELAKRLGISYDTLHSLVNRGKSEYELGE